LTAVDRGGIVNDLFALTLAGGEGYIPTADALPVLDFLTQETEYEVWVPALSGMGTLYSLAHGDTVPGTRAQQLRGASQTMDQLTDGSAGCPDKVAAWIADKLDTVIGTVGWEGANDPITAAVRSRVLSAGVAYGHNATVTEALRRYDAWVQDEAANPIPVDLQTIVWSAAIQYRGMPAFTVLTDLYAANDDAALRARLEGPLAHGATPDVINAALHFAISSNVRSQDSVYIIANVARSPSGRVLAWEFVQAQWDFLLSRYGQGGFALSRLVSTAAGGFTTQQYLDEVEAFFATHHTDAAEREVETSVEAVTGNIMWADDNLASMCAALACQSVRDVSWCWH
jgi:puromycin-sensitive aminopeptidase